MRGAADGALFTSVCILFVIALAAIQAGPPPGVNYQLPGWLSFVPRSVGGHTAGENQSTTIHSTVSSGPAQSVTSTQVVTSTSRSNSLPTSQGGKPGVAGASLNFVGWYLLIPIVFGLGVGMAILLMRRENPKVFDLRGLVEEMDGQRSRFDRSLSRKLRNMALLRYYLLMAEVCARVGIGDRPAETPHEFIGRAAAELDVSGPDSARFADAVDRAHYGVELSSHEVEEASRFMDSFAKTIVGRVAND